MSLTFASSDDGGFSFAVVIGDYTPIVVGPVISGTFTEIGDIYNLVTTAVNDGNWHWARTDIGVTLTADGSGGWAGGAILASGTQAVGVDTSDVTFDAGGVDDTMYIIHVYQRTAAGVDSNLVYATYTKDGLPSDVAPSFVGSAVHTSGSSGVTGLVCALPASPTIGNWQLLFANSADDIAFVTPAGWTAVSPGDTAPGGVQNTTVYAREVTASNVAETTVTLTGDNYETYHGLVFEIQDTDGFGVYEQGLYETIPSGTSHTGHVLTTSRDKSLLVEAIGFRTSLGGSSATGGVYTATNALLVWGTKTQDVAGLSTALTYGTEESESIFSGVLVEMLAKA